ncbi:MAG: sulfatase/phosphatase domain-containing protein, partial [Planctomycetia bacterium]
FDPRNTARLGEAAAAFLSETSDRPFLLVVGFTDPHRAGAGFRGRQPAGHELKPYDPKDVTVPFWLPDEPAVRQELADYYGCIRRMDDGVGAVMNAVEKSGRDGETLVVFLSDNGMPFPGAKTNIYDPAVRLPLIVRTPKDKRPGATTDAMASWVDVTPTILDYADAAPPKYKLHGRSLLPVVEAAATPAGWDEVYCSHTFHELTMYYPMRAVRDRKFKFIWNIAAPLTYPHASDLFESPTWQTVLEKKLPMLGARPVERYLHRDEYELYDLESDPMELKNLADDPSHAAVRKEMAAKLRAFQEKTNDPWVVRYKY